MSLLGTQRAFLVPSILDCQFAMGVLKWLRQSMVRGPKEAAALMALCESVIRDFKFRSDYTWGVLASQIA